MPYGLKIQNLVGELTVSSDAKLPYCLGRCTLQEIVQPLGESTGSYPGRVAGYSHYRVWTNGPVVFVPELLQGWYVGVTYATEVAPNVWDVYVSAGYAFDPEGFLIQTPLAVWAYGLPTTVFGASGLALYDRNGVLSCDFSSPNPLFPRAFVDASQLGRNYAFPSMSAPAILGTPNGNSIASVNEPKLGQGYVTITEKSAMWHRPSAAELAAVLIPTTKSLDYENYVGEIRSGKNIGFLIEAGTLP